MMDIIEYKVKESRSFNVDVWCVKIVAGSPPHNGWSTRLCLDHKPDIDEIKKIVTKVLTNFSIYPFIVVKVYKVKVNVGYFEVEPKAGERG